MKKHNVITSLLCLLIASLLFSCSDNLPEQDEKIKEDAPEAMHDKIREKPYPKDNNEPFINPASLIVPQSMKTGDYLQFSLSTSSAFEESKTITSQNVPWCMFNPHQELNEGQWFWRFRSIDKNGKEENWSETYKFTVNKSTPKFITPKFEVFLNNAPKSYPRLYSFLDNNIENARRKVTQHPEYGNLIGRANEALSTETENGNLYDNIAQIKHYTTQLYQAFHLTQKEEYRAKMIEFVRVLIRNPITDQQLFSSNFFSTDVASVYIKTYDIAQSKLTEAEKRASEEMIMKVGRYYYEMYRGSQENHIFDNHFWQHNMRVLFQVAFLLYTKETYKEEAKEMLEYYYELWTVRAPDSGYNRDGIWRNGTSYFNANVKTLYYMPSMFSYITKKDFLQHPWYQNVGKAMTYSWPPNSRSSGFGDASEKEDEPNRQRIAFADFIAREIGDSYAGWYATECKEILKKDFEFRLYRMVRNFQYANVKLPQNHSKLVWYKDAGEVVIHSSLEDMNNNLSLSFRSSPFGSGSHTLADQNSFNLLYKGEDVYRNSGYYTNFADAHNLMSYRHTRAHNTILVNGIGQPFSMNGYGNVVRAIGGENISYALGDASKSYSGISNDPMWIDYFKQAGVTQTPNNGFGETPLNRYRRHVLVLHPNIVVLYDELEANRNVTWDWLLHSPAQFSIDNSRKMIENNFDGNDSKSVAQIFSNHSFHISQTDQFVVSPIGNYAKQWHLTASFTPCAKNKILTIIQVLPNTAQAQAIEKKGNEYTLGEWIVRANLGDEGNAELVVENKSRNVLFNYGQSNPTINNQVHQRQSKYSSLLYDVIDRTHKIVEMSDYKPISTRMIK